MPENTITAAADAVAVAVDTDPSAAGAAALPPASGIRESEVTGIRAFLAAGKARDRTDAAHPTAPADPAGTDPATESSAELTTDPVGQEITAGLIFRVGTADETYATHGITHLVEHLALHRQGVTDVHYNGATGTTCTVFHVTGTEDEVVAYLNGVCASLRDLPLDRLETEREILRTEASGRSNGPNHQLPLWRYGAQGYGLSSYGELGSRHLSADAVRDWARTRFTRRNAVLWIDSDTVPPNLDLTLPEGAPVPMPAPTSTLPVTPAYVHGGDGVVVADGVVPRSAAAMVFSEVLGRALFVDLRQNGGYSYTATANYHSRDAEFAVVTAFADALPKKQDAVVGGFVDLLARLTAGRIEPSELASARGRLRKARDAQEREQGMLVPYAMNALTGRENPTPARSRAELEAVTVEDLRDVARAWQATALLQVPGRGADWAGFTEAPRFSDPKSVVTGTRHRSLDDKAYALIIGNDGISVTGPDEVTTVRFADCAAMLAYPDGARLLTGLDGFRIAVEPTMFALLSPERLALIDRSVAASVVVAMPARAADQIPRPDPGAAALGTTTPDAPSKARGALSPVRRIGLVLSTIVAGFFGVVAVVATWQELITPTPDFTVIAILWLFFLAPVLLIRAIRTGREVKPLKGR